MFSEIALWVLTIAALTSSLSVTLDYFKIKRDIRRLKASNIKLSDELHALKYPAPEAEDAPVKEDAAT